MKKQKTPKKKIAEIDEEDEIAATGSLGEEIDPENVNLVDLIDQPAWKTILIELVKSEKMDPWNIDIIELSGKYLQKISELGGTDLRIPANAILASAILLKFKSRILSIKPLDEEELAEALAMQQQLSPEQI